MYTSGGSKGVDCLLSSLAHPHSTNKILMHVVQFLYAYYTHNLPTYQDAGSKRGASKVETYLDICCHFHPVFHHFFMERFPCPSEWFERRLSYTRSVATSSIGRWTYMYTFLLFILSLSLPPSLLPSLSHMHAYTHTVGYVVGLGDRHVQNILIDTNTAEFIHIDLGKS